MNTRKLIDYEYDARWELQREWMETLEGLTEEESLDALCPEDEDEED